MPGFDGTGPRGMGPMTGGGRGFCNPWGRGAAFGGYGAYPGVGYGYPSYGWRGASYPAYGTTPYAPPITREQELDLLKNQAQAMRMQLEQIESRIQQLGSEK